MNNDRNKILTIHPRSGLRSINRAMKLIYLSQFIEKWVKHINWICIKMAALLGWVGFKSYTLAIWTLYSTTSTLL